MLLVILDFLYYITYEKKYQRAFCPTVPGEVGIKKVGNAGLKV